MAEKHRCEAPEDHRLCVNNCGFFGSPAMMNLCTQCYRKLHRSPSQSSLEISLSFPSSSSSSPSSSSSSSPSSSSSLPAESESLPPPLSPPALTLPEVAGDVRTPAVVSGGDGVVSTLAAQPNRCFSCRKRVGLTGFKCRCGTTYCGVHRYPEKHGCTFDFKAVGREEIARANPVVKAAKLVKI